MTYFFLEACDMQKLLRCSCKQYQVAVDDDDDEMTSMGRARKSIEKSCCISSCFCCADESFVGVILQFAITQNAY